MLQRPVGGGGAVCQPKKTVSRWPYEEKKLHINALELSMPSDVFKQRQKENISKLYATISVLFRTYKKWVDLTHGLQ